MTVCFCVWLLPLGAFIKGSMEKIACNGQRAFHMCTHMMNGNDASENAPSKVTTFNQSPQQNTAKSSASVGIDFLLLDLAHRFQDKTDFFYLLIPYFYSQSYYPSIDYPPEILSFI
jgi:hypothetical protein